MQEAVALRIDRSAVRDGVIAAATGVFVVALAAVGRAINGGLVALIGDNVLTQVNLSIATFVIENAPLVFVVVAAGSFALGVIEDRRDRDPP
ncbi:MAG: hypothetical protein H0U52_03700 [Chloroflexi bacterium]|nr:hypothetical protein [Chloroflexota bacterium]